jgi:exopolysaccharide biosynthesis polyprenyl glycosylphosphotransferase
MIREHRRSFRLLRQAADLSLLVGLWFAWLGFTTHVADPFDLPVRWDADYLRLGAFLAVSWTAAILVGGAYGNTRRSGLLRAIFLAARITALHVILFSLAVFVFKIQFLSRRFFFSYSVLSFLLLWGSKASEFAVLSFLRRFGYNTLSVLLVGEGAALHRALREFGQNQGWGYRVLGVLGSQGGKAGAVRNLGPLSRLPEVVKSRVVDLVVVCPGPKTALRKVLQLAGPAGVAVFELVPEDLAPLGPELDQLGDLRALHYDPQRGNPYARLAKSAFDISAAALLLMLAAPLLLGIAAAILLTMGRPVLFMQKRLGRNGRAFRLYKFRTMVIDARAKQEELAGQNVMGGPVFKVKDDPRVTSLGRFLRKTSLDELPQLLNVLRGELSLVGPRPLPTYEARKVPAWAWRRYSVKPGITCTWQVSGRNHISFEQWMRMDLDYIDRWSFGSDLLILLRTVPAVLASRGAY